MVSKKVLEEEVAFWLDYTRSWEVLHNRPAPYRAQQLLNHALLKLEREKVLARPLMLHPTVLFSLVGMSSKKKWHN